MKIEWFETQYDLADIQLIPFQRDRHCHVNFILELTIHHEHPYFKDIEKLAQSYAKSIKARYQLIITQDEYYKHRPFLDLVRDRAE